METHYGILGVKRSADLQEIKDRFRILAHKYHPDKNGGSDEARIVFRSVYEAYSVLSSRERREEYDRYLKNSTVIREKVQSYSRAGRNPVKRTKTAETVTKRLGSQLNFIFWEIEDLFSSRKKVDFLRVPYSGRSVRDWLLHILYFIDKWVVTPAGYGDSFYTARQIEGQSSYSSVLSGFSSLGHNPYMSFSDYFFQLRKRTDRFIDSLNPSYLSRGIENSPFKLIDCLYESLNLSYHYLGSLHMAIAGESEEIGKFVHSHILFDGEIKGILTEHGGR